MGSEMCIRDSNHPPLRSTRLVQGARRPLVAGQDFPPRARGHFLGQPLGPLLGRLLHHSVPGRSGPDQDQPPACPLRYCYGRHLRIVVSTTPWNWEPSPRGTAEFRCFPRNPHCSHSPHLVSLISVGFRFAFHVLE